MSNGLFFLRTPLPDTSISQGYRFSLRVVKTAPGKSAYLAFTSRELALMLASSPEIEAVSETAPDANCFRDFAARPILLFDCAVAIEQFLAQEPDFLYSHYLRQHVPNHPNLT